ncbi:MAG: acyl-CoA dehydrogenase family protein [Polyangiaceae bacterium]|nr:acyl-CoA dehydrogenase family protein [Polyangiaceae bacterium]MCB9605235.1 acyl-CoA dehydrogenase family protein [Polyangiaceae bacterium]
MDFELPEQHRILRQTVRDFCEREVRPKAREWDREERFPHEIVPKLAELGLLGIRIPEAYGGSEMDMLAYAIVVEECARVDGSLALTVASHNGLGTGHVLSFGNEEQKQKYLGKATTGEWLGAWALTEPGSGSDSAGMQTTAVRDGDDWVLNGTKMFITQGSVGGFTVVLARTNKEVKAQRGITAFIVEQSTPGYSASKKLEKYGCRSSDTVELTLENVRVSDAQRLGDVDHGFYDTMSILDCGRISIAAMALGLGRGALDMAVRYAKERSQFGRPIADFQAIQWMLADARTKLDAAELLIHRAADLADKGEPFSQQASMAKLFASEVATQVCNDSLQIHGGYGYTREFDIERHLRDAKICEIGEGTSQVQRIVIAKHLLA